jgi:hypothetical protein
MKLSELKEIYNKYGSMSITISGETETLKNLFDGVGDADINPFEEFASFVEGAIENGVDESNELELVTTALLDFLELTTFDFYNDDDIVTIEFNGDVVFSASIKEVYP